MEIKAFQFSPFAENTYLLYDTSNEAVIIDPGCYFPEEKKKLSDFISDKQLIVKKVLFTHCHLDHAFGANYIFHNYKDVSFEGDKNEQKLLELSRVHAQTYGLTMEEPPRFNKFISEGDKICFGKTKLHVISVPGHSPGGISFYNAEKGDLFPGDILFHGSVGRSDLPGGDHDLLINGIKTKLLTLPESVIVYPGHGDYTTIGNEKALNRFLQ